MNCACMYLLHPEDQTVENYLSLAKQIDGKDSLERYPAAISVVTRPVTVYNDINVRDGWVSGKTANLMPGSMILFVQGKLHLMRTYSWSFSRPAVVLFPNDDDEEEPFFRDIIEITEDFDYENNSVKQPKEPVIKDIREAEETYRYMYSVVAELPPDDFSFKDKNCVLSGKFTMEKKAAEEYIIARGGNISKSITGKTNVVIIGDQARYNCCDYGGRGLCIENALIINSVEPGSIAIYEERYLFKDMSGRK